MTTYFLVFGGRVADPQGLDFITPDALEIVGLFPDRRAAESAWRGAAQRTVDDAEMRFVVAQVRLDGAQG